MPERIQLRRTKGWRKPEGAVVVSRPSKWGNPYSSTGRGCTRETAVEQFRDMLTRAPLNDAGVPITETIRAELAGRDLACWCPLDQPCHADVLLAIANDRSAGALLGGEEKPRG